jgi:hypothetical protein
MIQINTLEEFSDVQDYYYYCTEDGKVWSNASGELKPRKQQKSRDGYLSVSLRTKQGKSRRCRIHRIVCTIYHPNPDNLPEVNHINHDTTDNRPENLEWVTKKGNTKDDPLWMEAAHKVHKQNQKKVMLYDVENCRVIVFQSATQCAEYLGTYKATVTHIITKRGGIIQRGKYKGCKLKYIEN